MLGGLDSQENCSGLIWGQGSTRNPSVSLARAAIPCESQVFPASRPVPARLSVVRGCDWRLLWRFAYFLALQSQPIVWLPFSLLCISCELVRFYDDLQSWKPHVHI